MGHELPAHLLENCVSEAQKREPAMMGKGCKWSEADAFIV